jgi:hypothetical protein
VDALTVKPDFAYGWWYTTDVASIKPNWTPGARNQPVFLTVYRNATLYAYQNTSARSGMPEDKPISQKLDMDFFDTPPGSNAYMYVVKENGDDFDLNTTVSATKISIYGRHGDGKRLTGTQFNSGTMDFDTAFNYDLTLEPHASNAASGTGKRFRVLNGNLKLWLSYNFRISNPYINQWIRHDVASASDADYIYINRATTTGTAPAPAPAPAAPAPAPAPAAPAPAPAAAAPVPTSRAINYDVG